MVSGPGGTEGESPELKKIASRCTEPGLQFATDEDAHGFAPDPLVNLFDLGKDPLEYTKRRMELMHQILPTLVDDVVGPGDSYYRVRLAFGLILRDELRALSFATRFIGGVYINRDHKGDPNARPPIVVTEASKQREALDFLDKQLLGPDVRLFPDELYNYIAPSHWSHWGMREMSRPDLPVHELVLAIQNSAIDHMLSPITLSRLLDAELKTPANQEVFTATE